VASSRYLQPTNSKKQPNPENQFKKQNPAKKINGKATTPTKEKGETGFDF